MKVERARVLVVTIIVKKGNVWMTFLGFVVIHENGEEEEKEEEEEKGGGDVSQGNKRSLHALLIM